MLVTKNAKTMLALFEGQSAGVYGGFDMVAFRVSANNFQNFIDRLETHPVFDMYGIKLSKHDVVNHGITYSLYFCDPYSYSHEVTTYEIDKFKL